MVGPIRFSAIYTVRADDNHAGHQLADAETILKREAEKLGIPLKTEKVPVSDMLVVCTEEDSAKLRTQQEYRETPVGDYWEQVAALARQADSAREAEFPKQKGLRVYGEGSTPLYVQYDFATSHYRYELIFGQPLFDVVTGRRPVRPAPLKPGSVPDKMGTNKKGCIT